MVIFNSYVTNYQRVVEFLHFCSPKIGWPDCHGSPRRDPASDGSNVSSPGIVIWIPNGHWSWLRNHQSCLSFQGVSIYIYGYMDIYPYIHIYICLHPEKRDRIGGFSISSNVHWGSIWQFQDLTRWTRPRRDPFWASRGSRVTQFLESRNGGIQLPSGNLLHSYWKSPFIVDFPIKNGDFP